MASESDKVSVVIFDAGDVLLTWRKSIEVLAEFSHQPKEKVLATLARHERVGMLGFVSNEQLSFLYATDLDIPNPENFDVERDITIPSRKAIRPTHELAGQLEKEEYHIGILSNAAPHQIENCVLSGAIPKINFTGPVVVSCDVHVAKPGRLIYLFAEGRAKRRLEVRPENILFVDDRPDNLVVPQELGWKVSRFDPDRPEWSVMQIRDILQLR